MPPSDVLCKEAGERGDLEGSFCMSLPARLGAAAVEGAEGRLRIQKPLAGMCQASGRACLLSAAALAWRKLRMDDVLMPISFSNTSCTVTHVAVTPLHLIVDMGGLVSVWQKLHMNEMLMPISFSNTSCTATPASQSSMTHM